MESKGQRLANARASVNLCAMLRLALFAAALLSTACCSAELGDLDAKQSEDRREALACLATQAESEPELEKPLLKLALRMSDPLHESDPSVRATALRVLVHLRAKAGVAAVQSTLAAESSSQVRREGVILLARLGGPQAVPWLRRLLRDDSNQGVRLACARELAGLGDSSPDTTDALVASLEDPSPAVRSNARRTLTRLLKTDQGDSSVGWRKWLERRGAPQGQEPGAPEGDEPEDPQGAPLRPPGLTPEEGGAPRASDYDDEPEDEGEPPRPEDYDFPKEDAFPDPDPKPEDPKPEDPKPEEPKPEEPKPEEPKPEEPKPEEPKPEEPKPEEPKPEEPKPEEPKPEEPKPEEPKPEEPKPEEPKPEEPKPEEPKPE
jgi:hypothetical protein